MADVTADEIEAAHTSGEAAAREVSATGPADPVLRVAWAHGFGRVDQLAEAINAARAAGVTWKMIGAATGEHPSTAATKYGGGRERQRRYQQRKRAEGE